MNLKAYLEKNDKEKVLLFYPAIEREMLFNFNAYKLKLVKSLEKITRIALPDEMLATYDEKRLNDFDKEINNVDTIYIASKADFETFDREKQIKDGKWVFEKGKLFLTITNPIYFKRTLIQEPKCWLTSNSLHLMNYIRYIDSNLAFEYFNKK